MFIISNTKEGQVTISFRTLIIIVVILLFLIAGGITLGVNWDNWFDGEHTSSNSEVWQPDIDEKAGDYEGTKPKDEGGEAVGIKIPGYPSIPVADGEKTAYVSLLNPEGNPCYFVFNIVLKDTGETIYTSKMVPPGQSINEVSLNKALAKGEYPATIQISTFSLSNGTAMNGANVETVFKVQ